MTFEEMDTFVGFLCFSSGYFDESGDRVNHCQSSNGSLVNLTILGIFSFDGKGTNTVNVYYGLWS